MNGNGVTREAVLSQLERVLASTQFRQAERSAGLLRFLVERSMNGADDRVKEYTVGVEFLGRGNDFDPRTDPIVRAEASRLRARLERYYASEGQPDEVTIELPKGSYVPQFRQRALAAPAAPAPIGEPSPSPRAARDRRPIAWAGLGILAVLAAFGAGVWSSRSAPAASEPLTRLEVQLQSDELLGSDVGTDVVIAPDGSRAVFVSTDSLGESHLRVRAFDGSAPRDLPGTTGARGPFWSPDSRWIGFWAARQLRKIPVNGGSPMKLCDAADLLGASWGDDGTIIAALGPTKRLWRIDGASGGTPVVVVDLTAENADPLWPQVLPGGKYVLYTAVTGLDVDRAAIEVASLADGRHSVVVKGGTFGRYVAPSHLTFVNQGTLYAVRFDPRAREARGPKVPIFDDVAYSATFGYAAISIAETGVAVYRRASFSGQLTVAFVDSAGRQTPLFDRPGRWSWPALSPDGQRLALGVVESGVPGLSVFTNLQGRPRLTWNAPGFDAAVWTRDGRDLVARGARGIAAFPAFSGVPRTLIESPKISVPWTFAPGDRSLAFAVMEPATAFDVWVAPIDKAGDTLRAGVASPVLRSPSFETFPAISPDGRWLAYASDEPGSATVYVRPLTDSVTMPIVVGAGRVPRWGRTGTRLFYTTVDHRLMVVEYTIAGGRFVPGTPRQWTTIRLADADVLPNYDLGPADRYIVALMPAPVVGAQAENHVTFVRGLRDELQRKVP